MRGYIKNVAGFLKNLPPDVKLIPGHGPLSGPEEMKKFHQMLVETTGIVEKAIGEGATLAEAQAAGLPEKFKGWEAPTLATSRWIEIVYKSLSRR